jgi:WD40 repeat protein
MDVASGELGPTLSHEDFVNTVAWSPDSSLLASSSAATIDDNFSPAVVVWDGTSGETVNVLAQEEPVLGLAFSPDGSRLASLNSSGTLQLWAEQ